MLPDAQNSPGLRTALALLARLAETGGLPFTRLRRDLDLPAATTARLLKVLAEEGWAAGGGDQPWRSGPAFRTAAWRLAPRGDLGALMQPVVDQLAEATNESAAIVEWAGNGVVHRAKSERPESYHYMDVGARNRDVPGHPFAQLCLSLAGAAAQRRYAAQSATRGVDFATLAATTKERGWHQGQDKGLRFCAPVLGGDGVFIMALGITLIPRELSPRESERLGKAVRDHARKAQDLLDSNPGATP